ncbi:MAG: carbonic anhydrase [Flavobacteriales bacterium]
MAELIKKLLEGNKEWVKKMNETIPDFFDQLSKGQNPQFLWIGCSDSRVPATEVTNHLPGSIFVHRNIANMVVHTDMNMLSVVYFAVKHLKIKHIIVCGHYGCGGVNAAITGDNYGFLNNWLSHIRNVGMLHKEELELISDPQKKSDRYVELNVQEQVKNLSMVSFIQDEWEKGEYPYIHGWVYSLEDGYIRDLKLTRNTVAPL